MTNKKIPEKAMTDKIVTEGMLAGGAVTEGQRRRSAILAALADSTLPLSGTELAHRLKVSRQVIVQDIALLRAEQQDILSTYRGYVLRPVPKRAGAVRVFCVRHETEQTLDEFETIVDAGGHVLDVFVEHALYGTLRADLIIDSRLDAAAFVSQMAQSPDQPLKTLTGGCHYHTVTAASEALLDHIEAALSQKGYLCGPGH